MTKEMRQLIKQLRRLGLTVGQTRRGGHWWVSNGERKISLPASPGDHRAHKNILARLVREGLIEKGDVT